MLTYHNIHKLYSYRFVKILLVRRYYEIILMCLVLLLLLCGIWRGLWRIINVFCFDINECCVKNEQFKQSMKLKFPKWDWCPKDEVAQIVPYGFKFVSFASFGWWSKTICFLLWNQHICVLYLLNGIRVYL